jgi:hypothetical protein
MSRASSRSAQLRLAEQVTPLNPALDRWTDYFAQSRIIRYSTTRSQPAKLRLDSGPLDSDDRIM